MCFYFKKDDIFGLGHITVSEMFNYKWKCFIVRPPILHWLFSSFLPLQYLFISFLSLPASTFLLVSITKFFPWHLSLDYIWTPVFFPKPHQVHASPQFLCARPVALQVCCWERDQGYKPSFGSHPCWKGFHMCKSFRTNTADSVSDYVQWHHRTTPCGTFPPITFQLSGNEHQKPPWRRKEKEEVSQKGSLRPGEKVEIKTVSGQAASSRCTGKSPSAKFSSCFRVVIPYAKIPSILTHCTSHSLQLFHSWLGEE